MQTTAREDVVGASLADAPLAYVVDDVAEDRTAVARLVVAAGLRAAHFDGGQAFLDALPGLEPGIVLLDVMMPDVSGPTVLGAIVEKAIGHVVIMMSARSDIPTAVTAMRRGAHDFLLKPLDESETHSTLSRAVNVMRDTREASQTLAGVQEHLRTITPKEMVVLRKLVAGKRNKNIAFELGVSERTIEVHRSRLIRRVEANTFAGLIAFAVKAGVEPDD